MRSRPPGKTGRAYFSSRTGSTRPATEGNKPAKLKAIGAALKRCDQVILATDCDREGQLIGQENLEHFGYRGTVQRALFTAQDPKSLRQAFTKLKPNREPRPLYEAAVARQQADQIFNLSLTRTATRTLLAHGVRGGVYKTRGNRPSNQRSRSTPPGWLDPSQSAWLFPHMHGSRTSGRSLEH
jgi:Toprim domain